MEDISDGVEYELIGNKLTVFNDHSRITTTIDKDDSFLKTLKQASQLLKDNMEVTQV